MTAVEVDIIGREGVHRMLANYTDPKLRRRLQAASKVGATVFKAPLKAEAGKVSKRMARAVSVRVAKRDKPATVISFRSKTAFFRHFVIRGTRDHGPRRAKALAFQGRFGFVLTKRVRGVKANPLVARIFNRYQGRAYVAFYQDLTRTEES